MEFWGVNLATVLMATGVYAIAAVLGALVLPLFFAPKRLLRFISGITENELNIRDKILLPVSKIFIRFNVHPNVITIVGVVLVAWLLAAFIQDASPIMIFTLTFLAGFSDMIDGPVARASGKVTIGGGIMDMARDVMLILVVTAGIIMNHLIDPRILIWFFGGEAVIFILKIWESSRRGIEKTIVDGFLWRAAGEGKPAVDRIKFFFFVAAVIAALLNPLMGFAFAPLINTLFALTIFSILFSIVIHAFLIRAVSTAEV
ncbi:MAG: CDP-alcohol phosphatidyltransferase [Parcubacteria group bacterium GW2011_GWA2_45_30]|nr:MAG: CDP-alcohol phosphatidyltransferase [Parcubacteria group bacterium GW2011_GWA2_45_30]